MRQKCRRLSVEVVVQKKLQNPRITTMSLLPSDIVTHEQVLKVLAGAMKEAAEPEAGFDYVTTYDDKMLIRKRK